MELFNVLFAAGLVAYVHSYPFPIRGNYDTLMVDDNVPAESIQYQNFQNFYNAEIPGHPMEELQMVESRNAAHIRAPQPLTTAEKHARLHDEYFDVIREKRNQKSLTKGNTKANKNGREWEEFDYDAYLQ
ncbi:uncharacterized protein LOC142235693 [Haematobia irritans]|uniref:uncharacterized protein LOC142235693 n=1 Tax=Haematobia irritans TaxID=7368 RepID=UPI003F4F48F6